MIKIKPKYLFLFPIYMLVSYFFIKYVNENILTYDDVNTRLASAIICLFLFHTIIFFWTKKQMTLSIIFIWLCYLFWTTRVFALITNTRSASQWQSLQAFGVVSYIQAIKYAVISIVLIYAGIMIGDCFFEYSRKSSYNGTITERNVKPLLFVSFSITLIQTIITIYYSITEGYSIAHDHYFSSRGIVILIKLFPIFIYFALVLHKDNKKVARRIYISFLLFQIIQMVGGERAFPVLCIIIITYLYFKIVESLKIKYVIEVILAGILVLNFLIIVREGRGEGNFTVQLLPVYTIVLSSFDEFGGTLNAIMKGFSQMDYHANGMVTVMSLISIIPGWTHIFGTSLLEKYYTMKAFDMNIYGSAFPIEYYFDYGYVGGLIGCFIQGIVVGVIDKIILLNIHRKDYKKNAFYIFLIIEIMYTVRSYPFRIPGYFLYFFIIMTINDFLFSDKRKMHFVKSNK